MKYLIASLFVICGISVVKSQIPDHLKGRISYPVLDQEPWIGVLDVEVTADSMMYDESIEYKVVIDVYETVKDNTKAYSPINEVARTYNLLSALGVPKEKIHMAVVLHAGGMNAFLSNAAYEEKFKRENPNMELIQALSGLGVKFYACGQSLGFLNIPNQDMSDVVEVALSAKTAFIQLDQKGYTYMNVSED